MRSLHLYMDFMNLPNKFVETAGKRTLFRGHINNIWKQNIMLLMFWKKLKWDKIRFCYWCCTISTYKIAVISNCVPITAKGNLRWIWIKLMIDISHIQLFPKFSLKKKKKSIGSYLNTIEWIVSISSQKHSWQPFMVHSLSWFRFLAAVSQCKLFCWWPRTK